MLPESVRYGLDDGRDDLERLGVEVIKDATLLGYFTGKDQAEQILLDHPKESLIDMPLTKLEEIDGFPKEEARKLVAAVELARRVLERDLGLQPVISCPADGIDYFNTIRHEEREHFQVLYLNARNQVIKTEIVSVGCLSSAIVHPREVFRLAVSLPAAAIIMGHNHPSGDSAPSQDDITMTKRLVEAGDIMGIDVLDHYIITPTEHCSMKERGLM